jgi:uroporphyrinogen decarboxylase
MRGAQAKLPSSKDRVMAALSLEEPDMVPFFDFLYNHASIRNIINEPTGTRITPEKFMKAQLALDFDLVCLFLDSPKGYAPRKVGPNLIVDEWGVKSKTDGDQSWYLDGTIKSKDHLKALQPPDPYAPGRTRSLEKILKKWGDKKACSFAVSGPFTKGWGMTGFVPFVKALYTDPSFVRQLVETTTKFEIEMGKIAIDAGVKILWITDDLGDVHGPMLSQKAFGEYIFPSIKTMIQEFKNRGALVLLHCDGNVMPLMDDLVNLGIDAFHPTERKTGMKLEEMKQRYGDRIALIGNVEASVLIPFGSLEEIDRQTRECFNTAAPGGGYIFASDHSIHPGVPAERARFLFENAKKYRKHNYLSR